MQILVYWAFICLFSFLTVSLLYCSSSHWYFLLMRLLYTRKVTSFIWYQSGWQNSQGNKDTLTKAISILFHANTCMQHIQWRHRALSLQVYRKICDQNFTLYPVNTAWLCSQVSFSSIDAWMKNCTRDLYLSGSIPMRPRWRSDAPRSRSSFLLLLSFSKSPLNPSVCSIYETKQNDWDWEKQKGGIQHTQWHIYITVQHKQITTHSVSVASDSEKLELSKY